MATKKTALKKTAKKAVAKPVKKRAYNRKIKPSAEAQMDLMFDTAAASGISQNGEVVQNSSILREIEVIDMRELSIPDRFSVLLMLESEGYIATSMADYINNIENLKVALTTDALVLQHNNKLVHGCSWSLVNELALVSRPNVKASDTNITFDHPSYAQTKVIQVDGVYYVRASG